METEVLTIKIKEMTPDNLDEVVSIEELVHPNHHWSKDSFLNEIQNKLACYYCVLNSKTNEILGFIGFWKILEEAHITTLSIHPNYHRLGLASVLMSKMIDDCYKSMIKYITLEVRFSNTPAISLYEKFGMKSVGARKKYYQDNNEDALIMFTENIWFEKFKSNFAQIQQTKKKVKIENE